MEANQKILTTIKNRTEARGQAADVEGLLAIIEAAEIGLQHARQTLNLVAPDHESQQREREESRMRREMAKAESSALYRAIMDQGGISLSSEDVREEYRSVPKSYRRKDGLPGDVVAEHLASNHPEFGITDENSLLQYFANRASRRQNERGK